MYISIYTGSSLLCLPNSQWVRQYATNSRNATGQWVRDKSQLLAQFSCLSEVPRQILLPGCRCVCACLPVVLLDSDSKPFILISLYKPMADVRNFEVKATLQLPNTTSRCDNKYVHFLRTFSLAFLLVASN